MNAKQTQEYHSFIRGAATYILLNQKDPPMDAQKIAALCAVDLDTINAEIDLIVQAEHHKVGGVFENMPLPAAQTR